MYLTYVLAAAILIGCGSVLSESVEGPQCDPTVVGNLRKYFPEGIPQDMAGTMFSDGPYSYVKLSAPNTEALKGERAVCVGFNFLNRNKVIVTKKLPVGAIVSDYTVYEKNGMFRYKSLTDTEPKYKMYNLYFKNGVAVTYRCCESCKGSVQNVGIAVSDRLRDSPLTQMSIMEATNRLQQLRLDDNLVDLSYCSDLPS